jgi:hypothetical protein
MFGEGTVAVRAEAAAILLSTLRVHAQAGMLIRVKRAKIQTTPSGWPGPIELEEILDVVGLIVPGDGDSCAIPLGSGWPGCSLGWKRQLEEAGAAVLAVGVMQFG